MAVQELWLLAPVQEPLQLVLLVVNCVLSGFFAILGCYLFCLNFNFYGFQVLLLEFK